MAPTNTFSARQGIESKFGSKLAWFCRAVSALADQGLTAGSGFFVSILLGRWLPSEQYGAYALGFSIFLFISGIHNALLLEPMSVLGPTSYRSHLPEYLGRLLGLHLVITLFLALFVALGVTVIERSYQGANLASALAGVGVGTPCILFFWLWRRAAYLELKPWLAVRGAAVYCPVVLALLFLFEWLGWLSPFTGFLLQALAAIAGGLLLAVCIRPPIGPGHVNAPIAPIVEQHWRYGRWVLATAFVHWVSWDAYYIIMGALLRIEDIAGLRAVQNVTMPVNQFSSAMSILLLPWASARFVEQNGAAFRKGISRINLLFGGVAAAYILCLLFVGRWMVEILYGGRYNEFAYLLPLIALAVFVTSLSQGFAIGVRAMQAPFDIFLGYAAGALLTLMAGVVMIRLWGLVGVALGMLISPLGFLVVINYRYKMRLRNNGLNGDARKS